MFDLTDGSSLDVNTCDRHLPVQTKSVHGPVGKAVAVVTEVLLIKGNLHRRTFTL